jgi:hypothetical protein
LTASQLAKNTYGSFATAWEVMKHINLLHENLAVIGKGAKE